MDKQDIFNDKAVVVSNAKEILQQKFVDDIFRFNIETNSFKYYCLLRKSKLKSKKLYVFLHGAKDREKNKPPYFDRWSWNEVFDGHMLSFSDPTLQLNEKLGLAWYVGNDTEHPLDTIVEIVEGLAHELSVDKSNIIFWGSSGGGFASIYSSLKLDGSKAVTFNPQTNALHYHVRHVKKCLTLVFNISDPENVNEIALNRMSIPISMLKCTASRIVIFQNLMDSFHYENHFLKFKKSIVALNKEGFQFYTYSDSRGHGPESKDFAKEVCNKIESVFVGSYAGDIKKDLEILLLDVINSSKKFAPEIYIKTLKDLVESQQTPDKKIVKSFYLKGSNDYPGGWNIKFWYAEYLIKICSFSEAHDVLSSIFETFTAKNVPVPKKVLLSLKACA